MKQKKIILLILLVLTFLSVYVIIDNSSEKKVQIEPIHIEGISGPGTNSYSYGLYSNLGKLYEGDSISIDQGEYTSIFSLSNFYDDEKTFMFIVLLDNIPGKFVVNDEEYEKYEFKVGIDETYQIPFDINVKNNSELAILAFPNPDGELLNYDSVLQNQNLLYLRYKITDGKVENVPKDDTIEFIEKSSENVFEPVFLSSEIEELQVPLAFEKNKLYLHLSNPQESLNIGYNILYLNDYKVLEVNGNSVNYVSVEPNTRNVYEVKKPKFKGENSTLEIIAIPVSNEDQAINQLIFHTTRVGIDD